MQIFYNDTKKISYYKNVILGDFAFLLHSKGIEKDYIDHTFQDLDALISIAPNEKDEMVKLFNTYMLSASSDNDAAHINTKLNFYSFASRLYYEKYGNYIYKSYFLLNALYSNYDIGTPTSYYASINQIITQFFADNHLNANDTRNAIKNQKNKNIFDYFSFFLEKILVENLSTASENDMGDVIKLMEKFISLNGLLYSEGDDTRKVT